MYFPAGLVQSWWMTIARKPYPADVSDEEWSLVAPHLALMREDAGQQQHSPRKLFNRLRYLIRYEIAWPAMPNDAAPAPRGGTRSTWRR
jgi:hypothetical protein